jgi:hypothetical protein
LREEEEEEEEGRRRRERRGKRVLKDQNDISEQNNFWDGNTFSNCWQRGGILLALLLPRYKSSYPPAHCQATGEP